MGFNVKALSMKKTAAFLGVGSSEMTGAFARQNLVVRILTYLARDAALSMKNLYISRLRVTGPHQNVYDVYPEMVIMLILSLEEAKKWKPGIDYEIVIVCATAETYEAQLGSMPFRPRANLQMGEASLADMKRRLTPKLPVAFATVVTVLL
jgi:hypothetical protein